MPRKIADTVTLLGDKRSLRKSYDSRVDIGQLTGPVTASPHFGIIIPGLQGTIFAVIIRTNEDQTWLAFFLDGTMGSNYQGELDGLYILENGEELDVFIPYFWESFPKIHGKSQIRRLIESYLNGDEEDDEDGEPTLDLSPADRP